MHESIKNLYKMRVSYGQETPILYDLRIVEIL